MQARYDNQTAKTARQKIASGALLSLAEVCAVLGVSHATVHRLPLQSILVGRQYRYDPKDVTSFIDNSKEAI